ncbi:MAG: hypothetical protein IT370_03190 [Deltaproteobacteria bacterium]|nr:hypothetical protein [Deltaproteobacteria bacterium]
MSTETRAPAAEGRLRYIDALRGVAACWVMFYHHSKVPHDRLPRLLHFPLARGWLGVDIFFVLSGLAHVLNVLVERPTIALLRRVGQARAS